VHGVLPCSAIYAILNIADFLAHALQGRSQRRNLGEGGVALVMGSDERGFERSGAAQRILQFGLEPVAFSAEVLNS
jgi:hypothetical protein